MKPDGYYCLLLTCFFVANASESLAGPGGWDRSFIPNVSGGAVYSVGVQLDGKVLIGGAFTSVSSSTSRAHLARLYADGSLDTTFFNSGNGVSAYVWCLALQSDGRIVIGGDFSNVNGTNRTRVARLNSNGTVDGSFVPTNTINSSVFAVAAQSDNKVIIGGIFSGPSFPSFNARLNSDGTLDSAFSSFPNGSVNAIAIQTDGKIVIGGTFTQVNGAPRNRIARQNNDGSLDNTFQNGMSGANQAVRCLQIQPDGKILVGGDFTTINGTNRGHIARLNSNGSLDLGFGSVAGTDNSVYTIALQTDSEVEIGGSFLSYALANLSHTARLYPDGTRDTTFGSFGINNIVQALAVQSDGGILIGGTFTTISNTASPYLGRLYGNLYPPEFITQPISRGTNVGATATFSALVNNPTPTSYQWRKDGINIATATGLSYTLSNIQFSDAGNYSVFVSNGAGGTTSSNAVLSVGVPPNITGQPGSMVLTQGQTANFSVTATGTPLNYYWRKGGVFLSGATNSSYSISNVVDSDASTYTCQVSNFLNSITSAGAMLTVYSPPIIAVQPASQIVGVSSNFSLNVVATGNPSPAYQWAKDGHNILGATNVTYSVTGAQTNDSGGYSVVLTNIFGSATSALANISVVYYPPTITQEPHGSTLVVGSEFGLSVSTDGSPPLAYQWRKDGNNIPGANTVGYTVINAQTNDTGAYTVVIANPTGSKTSALAQVNVGYPPRIMQQPLSFTNNPGTSNVFSVVVSGSEPMIYQWFKEGLPILNATNNLLSFSDLQSNHVGFYFVTVTNIYGSTTSSNVILSMPGFSIPFQSVGLVGYYPFNGNADDETPNANNGNSINCQPTLDRFGNPTSAYFFNGSTSKITASNRDYLDFSEPSEFTISVWATRSASQSWSFILGKDDVNVQSSIAKWILILGAYHNIAVPTLTFHFVDSNANAHWIGSSNIVYDVGVWHQYAVSRSNSLFSIFQDGKLVETETDTGVLSSTNSAPLTIGNAEGGGWHEGDIDDVRIYNRAMSVPEIAQLYNLEADVPLIRSQPQSQITMQDKTVTFNINAIAQNALTWQWSRNGAPYPSETNATLMIPFAQPSDAGVYTAEVNNGLVRIISAPATLTVISSSGSGMPGFISNQFGFGLSGALGANFIIESSSNLTIWQPIITNVFGSGLFQFVDPSSVSNASTFYRIRTD